MEWPRIMWDLLPAPARDYTTRGRAPGRIARAANRGALPLEPVGSRHVRVVRVQFGGEPARGPAEEARHAPADGLRTIPALTRARADARAAQQEVLKGYRHLVLHGQVELGHDVGIARTERLRPVGDLAGEREHRAVPPAVELDQGLEGLATQAGRGRLRRDVHPRPRLDEIDVIVRAVQREVRRAARRGPSQRAHHAVADLLRQAA